MSAIEQRHNIPLTTAISASTPGKGALVTTLYHETENVFYRRQESNGNVIRTRTLLKPEESDPPTLERVLATVTDQESGLFVQLSGVLDTAKTPFKVIEGPFLAYGKKFLAEIKNPQLQNTATKLWR
jgi:hypothetical protein